LPIARGRLPIDAIGSWRSIDLRATAVSGLAVITAVIVAFLWEITHRRSGQPYALLGAIAGIPSCSRWCGCVGAPELLGS
jgi:hypothetical protein